MRLLENKSVGFKLTLNHSQKGHCVSSFILSRYKVDNIQNQTSAKEEKIGMKNEDLSKIMGQEWIKESADQISKKVQNLDQINSAAMTYHSTRAEDSTISSTPVSSTIEKFLQG